MSAKSGMKECVRSYAEKRGCTLNEAEKAIKATLEVIKQELIENGGVSFIGLFSLEVVERKERQGFNPSTGEMHTVPAHNSIKIKVGKQLKEELNK